MYWLLGGPLKWLPGTYLSTHFGEWTTYKPTDSILKPKSLIWIHSVTINGSTPMKHLNHLQSGLGQPTGGTMFGRFWCLGELFQGKFWHNWAGQGDSTAFQSTWNCTIEFKWPSQNGAPPISTSASCPLHFISTHFILVQLHPELIIDLIKDIWVSTIT